MTVGWLLKIFNPEGSVNSSVNTSPIITSQDTRLVQPIISGGVGGFGPSRDVSLNSDLPPPPQPGFSSNSPGFFHRDFQNKDLSLPVFSADYPAFFILILLITLTMFALFVLLFLCCLDGDDLIIYLRRDSEREAPEPEPPFKEVATETDMELEQAGTSQVVTTIVDNETEVMTSAENPSESESRTRTPKADEPEETVEV